MYLSSGAGGAFHIWRQRFPDGEPEQITSGPTEEDGIAMAADGRSFVTAVASRQSAVWVHGPEGERQVSLEGFAFDPKFTPDGKKLLYRILKGATLNDASELRVTDLESGLTEPLLPGIDVMGSGSGQPMYDITRDGRQAVVAGVDGAGKRRLLLVPLDLRSPPRAIPGVEGVYQPQFGASGEILFGIRAMEGLLMFPHVVREDGTGLRKLSDGFIGIKGLSPDNKWLAVVTVTKDERGIDGRGIIARSLTGETDFTLIAPSAGTLLTEIVCKWSPDGRTVAFVPVALYRGQGMKVYTFPLPPGRMFPPIPPGGFRSEAEMAKVPGAKALDVFYDYASGPVEGVYAFTRESVQRNLYRVPLR
jgi:Tol biopolymer transport system component